MRSCEIWTSRISYGLFFFNRLGSPVVLDLLFLKSPPEYLAILAKTTIFTIPTRLSDGIGDGQGHFPAVPRGQEGAWGDL